MASSGRLSDEIQRLAALVEQTSADLSSARATRATAAIRQHRSGSRLGATATLTPGDGAAASTDGQSVRGMDSARLALPTKNAIALTDLRRDLDERARRVDELVMLIEGDVRAIKREHGEAMDGTRRVDARLDRLVQTVGVVEARQKEMFEQVQERPTRGEVDTTISASVMPGTTYTKTRLDALHETVSKMHAEMDSRSSRGGLGNASGGSGDRPSLDYIEQRLERRLEDFLERKMRLKARQLEIDVVHALKSNEDVRSAWGLNERGTGGKKEGGEASEGCLPSAEQDAIGGADGENTGASAMNSAGSASAEAQVKYVTQQDLDKVRETFAKEVRLVQNSLVSLRTQVRALGREVKEMKER